MAISEGASAATVTVTRAGGVALPAAVSYATSDPVLALSCSISSGLASARCDYISTSGRLNFAAGETEKIITILIIDDSYAEGSETLVISLSNPVGPGVVLGSPATTTITINDNESSNGANQIGEASYFVRQHYIDFLNREPDASGLAFWTNEIEQCGANSECLEIKRINVSAAFFLSIEFQQTGYLVERLYRVAFGTRSGRSMLGGTPHFLAVPIIRLEEFLPDTQAIARGVIVGQAGWEVLLESNKQNFIQEFVERSRFTTEFP